jgi:hypothetical protein
LEEAKPRIEMAKAEVEKINRKDFTSIRGMA